MGGGVGVGRGNVYSIVQNAKHVKIKLASHELRDQLINIWENKCRKKAENKKDRELTVLSGTLDMWELACNGLKDEWVKEWMNEARKKKRKKQKKGRKKERNEQKERKQKIQWHKTNKFLLGILARLASVRTISPASWKKKQETISWKQNACMHMHVTGCKMFLRCPNPACRNGL